MRTKHENVYNCLKCNEILIKFNGLHDHMYLFVNELKKLDCSAHISCASRGRVEQEVYFQRGASNARYGKSAHNYGAAVDIFRIDEKGLLSYSEAWFNKTVGKLVKEWNKAGVYEPLDWYGAKGSEFYERPHVELDNWKKLGLKLAE